MSRVLPLVLLLSAMCLTKASAQEETNSTCGASSLEGKLSVTGQSVVKTTPDMAIVSLTISVTKPTAGEARDVAANVTSLVREAIDDVEGVNSTDIATQSISLYPKIDYNPLTGIPNERVSGYVYEQTLSITVNNLSNETLSQVLDVAVSSGGDQLRINGITVDLSPALKRAAMDEARVQAVQDAKKTAELLAESAGVSLSGIKSIIDGNSAPSVPVSMPFLEKRQIGGGPEMAADIATPTTPQDVEVLAMVSIDYAICNTN